MSEPIKPAVLTEALKDSDDFTFVTSTPLKAEFTKVSGKVHLTGSFDVTVRCPCKRCLLDVESVVPVAFSLRMVRELTKSDLQEEEAAQAKLAAAAALDPTKRQRRKKHSDKQDEDDDDDLESVLDLDDADAEPFDGRSIDLDPIVREQVLLALPVSVFQTIALLSPVPVTNCLPLLLRCELQTSDVYP